MSLTLMHCDDDPRYLVQINVLGSPIDLGIDIIKVFTGQSDKKRIPRGENKHRIVFKDGVIWESTSERPESWVDYHEYVKTRRDYIMGIFREPMEIQVLNRNVMIMVGLLNPSERYQELRFIHCKHVSALLFFFDKNDPMSFQYAEQAYTDYRRSIHFKSHSTRPIALVGLQSKHIPNEAGRIFAEKHDMRYYEVHPTNYDQIYQVFFELTSHFLINKNIRI